MAAPSRSFNYRRGTGSVFQIDPDSYYALLRAMQKLPKEASDELRRASREIADEIVTPAIESAMRSHIGNYAPKMIQSIRTGRDRIPKVIIGYHRTPYFSGDRGRTGWTGQKTKGKRLTTGKVVRQGAYAGEVREPASTIMLRYGTVVGEYRSIAKSTQVGRWKTRGDSVQNWAKNITPGWTKAASHTFTEPAFLAWENEIESIVTKWNRGK